MKAPVRAPSPDRTDTRAPAADSDVRTAAGTAIETPVEPPVETPFPVVERALTLDNRFADRRAAGLRKANVTVFDRRVDERREGYGLVEPRRITGRRAGPLPAELAFMNVDAEPQNASAGPLVAANDASDASAVSPAGNALSSAGNARDARDAGDTGDVDADVPGARNLRPIRPGPSGVLPIGTPSKGARPKADEANGPSDTRDGRLRPIERIASPDTHAANASDPDEAGVDRPGVSDAKSDADAGTSVGTTRRVDLLAALLLVAALLCSALVGYLAGPGTEGAEGRIGLTFPFFSRDDDAGRIGLGSGTSPGAGTTGGTEAGPVSVMNIGADFGLEPVLGAALAAAEHAPPAGAIWTELGRVRAEIIRLRVLFRRLADVAELDDGEFDLDLEPMQVPAVRDATRALDLSIRALDPISRQGGHLARIFEDRRAAHDRRIAGRVASGVVRTSGFGYRPAPFGGRRQVHRGIDFAGPVGTPVLALADGIVAFSGPNGAYGNLVEIEHGDGYRTRYAHNQSNLVSLGQRVAKGDVVATLGSSGRSTGPHVHVEVRLDGTALDPAAFIN